MIKYLPLGLLCSLLSFDGLAAQKTGPHFDHSHTLWTEALEPHLRQSSRRGSRIHYQRWLRNPDSLERYLGTLESIDSAVFAKWSSNQRKAFFINAYNAYTAKLVLSLFPIDSLKDLAGFFSSPWSTKSFTLFGKKRSLDWIEHTRLRDEWLDPRTHFALNHATRSSPYLKPTAYQPDTLDADLDQATRDFLSRSDLNYWTDETTLHLSRIFYWYRNDFRRSEGSLGKFIARWKPDLSPEQKQALIEDRITFVFEEYDWRLNAH